MLNGRRLQPVLRAFGPRRQERPTSFIDGARDVGFNDDGRLFYPGAEPSRPSNNLLFWRRDRAPVMEEDTREWRYRPYRTRAVNEEGVTPGRAAIFTRRVDGPDNFSGGAKEGPVTTRNMKSTMKSETLIVEEMKVYDEKPCWWLIWIAMGIVMIVCGIANIMLCWDYHYYFRFWTGIFLIIYGGIGGFHQGDYVETKLKSWLYIFFGFVTNIMVLATAGIVMMSFAHQVIELTQFGQRRYLDTQIFRYEFLGQSPLLNLTNWEYNTWACFGLDGLMILLCMVGFGVLTSTLYVVDRFFNSHFVITKKVEPFCEPWVFNPWAQCTLGQIEIYIGLILLASTHGTFGDIAYEKTGAAIWAGIIPLLAGLSSALCLKSCDPKRRLLNFVTIVLEILSIASSLVATILLTLGIVDNVESINHDNNVMINTNWPVRMMVASSALFALSNLVCIINVFWSISLLVRIMFCICTNCFGKDLTKRDTEKKKILEEGTEISDEVSEIVEPPPRRFPDRRRPGPNYDDFEDPYRPTPASRKFYVR